MDRKGNGKGADGAVVLILLIAVFILVYVILIPTSDREELINLNTTTISDNGNGITQDVLLDARPGTITTDTDSSIKHEILPVRIFVKDEPKIESLASALNIENNLFSTKDQTVSFTLDNPSSVKESALFFYVTNADGNLKITLNGQTIHDQAVQPRKLSRIMLPLTQLKSTNSITFSVDKGIFSTNTYSIESVEVRNNINLQNPQEERTVNLETPVESADLSYSLFCQSSNILTTLEIFVNNKEQFTGIVPCTSTQTLELDVDILNDGTNTVLFALDQGDFQVSNIVLTTEQDTDSVWSTTFKVDSKTYNAIQSERHEVLLTLELSGNRRKQANILINDASVSMDTESRFFDTFITSKIRKGTNEIEIEPDSNFKIDELQVTVGE